ncbi:MAG: hypothetical protein ACJATT_005155, partial [Myxococcota bacterium]
CRAQILTMAWIQAFMPGASPPEVSTAMAMFPPPVS